MDWYSPIADCISMRPTMSRRDATCRVSPERITPLRTRAKLRSIPQTAIERYERGESVHFALVLRPTSGLVGAMSLQIHQQHSHAELGLLDRQTFLESGVYAGRHEPWFNMDFEVLGLNRVYAECLKSPKKRALVQRLYKALAPGAKPRFDTVLKVTRALGVKLTAKAA